MFPNEHLFLTFFLFHCNFNSLYPTPFSFLICISAVSAITYFDSKNVTYSNETTGMTSNNIQTAIDELYNVCFPPKTGGDAILDEIDIVTEGNGLYEDEYENGKYTYKGANPNNYVTFNGEIAGWRIISINSDGSIKIMKYESIENMEWDSSNNNNWTRPATLNTYLNGTYYNNLTSIAQNQIITSDYSIGPVGNFNTDLENQINVENNKKWNGKVALATVSEYIRSNSDKSNCGTFYINNNNYTKCQSTSWMYINDSWWTLSIMSGSYAYRVDSSGHINSNYSSSYGVRPVVTLSSSVQITGGDGSQDNPYQLSSK